MLVCQETHLNSSPCPLRFLGAVMWMIQMQWRYVMHYAIVAVEPFHLTRMPIVCSFSETSSDGGFDGDEVEKNGDESV